MSMKIYICPECGKFREVSRRRDVVCMRCQNEVPMELIKLTMEEYFDMSQEERDEYAKSWLYIHGRLRGKN